MKTCPSWIDAAEWQKAYDAEAAAIQAEGWEKRRDKFNADFPAPYTGPITAEAARYAALCDNM